MIRKDFILRLIEEVAKAIAKILHLLKDGDNAEAQKLYDSVFSMMDGVDEERLLTIPVEDYYKELAMAHGEVDELFQSLAHLLFSGAKLTDDTDKAQEKLKRSLEILEFVESHSSTYSYERGNLIAQVRGELT